MKKIIIFCLVFLFIFNIFSEEYRENYIKIYMESKNQIYPININTSLENSFYRDHSLPINENEGIYLSDIPLNNYDLSLTTEQKMKLEEFLRIFLSDNKYIEQLQLYSETNTFSINNIFIEHYPWAEEDDIVLSIMFYSENKIWELWQFNEKNNIWWCFNMAYYKFSNGNIEFGGWGI
jgi:hypothetical protein